MWSDTIISEYICFLITILYSNRTLKCALKVKRDVLTGDCSEYPMEPENRDQLHKLLPEHVKSCGPIIDVKEVFDIHVVE